MRSIYIPKSDPHTKNYVQKGILIQRIMSKKESSYKELCTKRNPDTKNYVQK